MMRPIHFEFQASDPDRAAEFYKRIFGWNFQLWKGGAEYWIITTGKPEEKGIDGGMLRLKEGAAGLNTNCNTIEVPDLDKHISKVKEAGGTQVVPKMPIPGMGWLAYCKDTEGNIFGMMQTDPSAK